MKQGIWQRAAACVLGAIFFGIVSGSAKGAAQDTPTPPPGMDIVNMPLISWVASRDRALPDTLPNFVEDPSQLELVASLFEALAKHQWENAEKLALQAKYQLVAVQEGGIWFVVASDNSVTGRDATLVINITPRIEAIVVAPHVRFEMGTSEQAILLLQNLGARAALLSGAHRCASLTHSSCDGETRVCGGGHYRDSDVAHNPVTTFHRAHRILTNLWKSAIVLSLHGMSDNPAEPITSMVVSNGAPEKDDDHKTAATQFRIALEGKIGPPGRVVSCNLSADDGYPYRRLCAYDDVQGRELNGSTEPCHTGVTHSSGRFIHIEQDWSVLKPYAWQWENIRDTSQYKAVLSALNQVLSKIAAP